MIRESGSKFKMRWRKDYEYNQIILYQILKELTKIYIKRIKLHSLVIIKN